MRTPSSHIVQTLEVGAHERLALVSEFGTTLITVIPHISGAQRYRIKVEYVPFDVGDTERVLEIKRN